MYCFVVLRCSPMEQARGRMTAQFIGLGGHVLEFTYHFSFTSKPRGNEVMATRTFPISITSVLLLVRSHSPVLSTLRFSHIPPIPLIPCPCPPRPVRPLHCELRKHYSHTRTLFAGIHCFHVLHRFAKILDRPHAQFFVLIFVARLAAQEHRPWKFKRLVSKGDREPVAKADVFVLVVSEVTVGDKVSRIHLRHALQRCNIGCKRRVKHQTLSTRHSLWIQAHSISSCRAHTRTPINIMERNVVQRVPTDHHIELSFGFDGGHVPGNKRSTRIRILLFQRLNHLLY